VGARCVRRAGTVSKSFSGLPVVRTDREPLSCAFVSPGAGAAASTYTSAFTLGTPAAALVITAPPYECPTSTIGPRTVFRKSATYRASVMRSSTGFAIARTRTPSRCSIRTSPAQLDASAHAPWTSTTVGALSPVPHCLSLSTVDGGFSVADAFSVPDAARGGEHDHHQRRGCDGDRGQQPGTVHASSVARRPTARERELPSPDSYS
jgi:hypothetical protein